MTPRGEGLWLVVLLLLRHLAADHHLGDLAPSFLLHWIGRQQDGVVRAVRRVQ